MLTTILTLAALVAVAVVLAKVLAAGDEGQADAKVAAAAEADRKLAERRERIRRLNDVTP